MSAIIILQGKIQGPSRRGVQHLHCKRKSRVHPADLCSIYIVVENPGQHAYIFVIRILSTPLTSVLIISVRCCPRYVSLWWEQMVLFTEQGVETKQGECICPLICSVNCNFVSDGKQKGGWACNPHPHQPELMECTPEFGRCHSVCTLWFHCSRYVHYNVHYCMRKINAIYVLCGLNCVSCRYPHQKQVKYNHLSN